MMDNLPTNEDTFKPWFLERTFGRLPAHIINIDLSDNPGVPDTNYCVYGIEGWVEFKWIEKKSTIIRPSQVRWFRERSVAIGNCFLVWGFRDKDFHDSLYYGILPGASIEDTSGRLKRRFAQEHSLTIGCTTPGVTALDNTWDRIRRILLKQPIRNGFTA